MTRQTHALFALVLTCFGLFTLAVWSNSGVINNYYEDLKVHSLKCEADRKSKERDYKKDCQGVLYRTLDDPITLLTALLALFAAGSVVFTFSTAKSARDQLKLAYPPKFAVINPYMRLANNARDPITLITGQSLSGVIEFMLTGRDIATVRLVTYQVIWTDRPLPMLRTYVSPEMRDANIIASRTPSWAVNTKQAGLSGKLINVPFEIRPGDSFNVPFETQAPEGAAEGQMKLYLVGWISFSDPMTPNRYSLFARRYDPGLGRFVVVKNPDYQRESESDLGQDGGE